MRNLRLAGVIVVGIAIVVVFARVRARRTVEPRIDDRPARAAREKPPAPARPASDGSAPLPEARRKLLALAAPKSATEKEIADSVAILNRRFARARIDGSAEASGQRIIVRLRDDEAMLRRAGSLLVAGGHLQFLAVVDEQDMPEAGREAIVARLCAEKARGTFKPELERYDALPFDRDPKKFCLVKRWGGVEGHLLATASARRTPDMGWVIDFTMNPEGTEAFLDFTTQYAGREFAVVLDNVVKEVFFIREPIRESGMFFRSGKGFTEDEAVSITALVTSGRLPIELELEEQPLPAEEGEGQRGSREVRPRPSAR
jgi:preprotein translocase subunit SecD